MKRAVLLCLLVVACDSTTGTRTVTAPDEPKAAAPAAVPNSGTVVPTPGSGFDCAVASNGRVSIRNLTDIPQTYYGWSTELDQALATGPVVVVRQPNDWFDYTGKPTCSQVDIGHEGPDGNNVLCAAWYNADGSFVNDPRKLDWSKCVPTPKPSPTPSPSPTPTPLYCYYEVDCGNQLRFSFRTNTACPDSTKKSLCEQRGGEWQKWISQGKEHCRIPLPGVSVSNFQLTPGQSAPGCLSKHDID